MNSLLEQVKKQSKTIATDSYSMSVGELLGMYKEKELILRPEFQRFFRWSDAQKSRLIESVLLGIPLPSIFVSQKRRRRHTSPALTSIEDTISAGNGGIELEVRR